MSRKQPRQKCDQCGASYRYDVDFQEHKRLGCKVESGKGDSLAADPDESPSEEVIAEAPEAVSAPTEEPEPQRQRRKKN